MDDTTIQAPQSPSSPDPQIVKSQLGLRLWPAVTLIAVLWLARLYANTGEFAPSKFFFGLVITPMAVIGGLLVWMLFASRLRWSERFLITGVFVAVLGVTVLTAGTDFPVMALIMYAAPIVASVWIGWLLVSGWLSWPTRRNVVLMIFVGTGIVCSILRLEGMDGEFKTTFRWRWTPTAEQRLLTELKSSKTSVATASATDEATDLVSQPGDWPAFRGAERNGRLTGVQIKTDWEQSPPKELWRHRIGPGWSSMSIVADKVFTQEQRGDEEFVVCYDGKTGQEIWSHHDATRFFEVVAGPGPRATPTFDAGKLYVLGANGALNCLNASTGKLIWTRNIAKDTEAKVPMWGFSSSPLVADGCVIVFAGAPSEKSIVAYRADSGDLAWTAGQGSLSYCSPQLEKVDGVEQVLINTDAGMSSLEPTTGKIFWHYAWEAKDIARVVQPVLIGARDLLIGTGMGVGTRRISVSHEGDDWQIKEKWTTKDIKPYFNDLVVSGDYLYGFDGNIFMCVSIVDGTRKWRARGYGNGQVLLLADQQLLLIISETGEVALVAAKPDKHEEIAKFKAIEGKTWNHPVVCQGKLFVRNAEEIACFQLDQLVAVKETDRPVDQNKDAAAVPE
jgi:outer membrane protein assembly factor BamB